MTRWRALGDDLDPQIREFTVLLRRRVERGGVSVAELADATGYSRSSWERYLNGRMLPPRYAVVALAQVTGTEPGHLTTMWELTERAWNRAEGRHDVTMTAARVAEARAALGEFGPPPDADADAGDHADADAGDHAGRPRPGRRRGPLLLAGVVAVVLAVLGTTVLLGRIPSAPGGTGRAPASPSGSPSVTARTLTGKDPETAGCGGAHARTAASAWVGGTYLEMRYSADCGTVWARVSAAAPGDTVSVTTGDATRRRRIGADAAAYTRMLTVRAPDRAKACVTLATGVHGCTPPGR